MEQCPHQNPDLSEPFLPSALVPCRGFCPTRSNASSPIACEGACSHLVSWALYLPQYRRAARPHLRGWGAPLDLLLVLVFLLSSGVGCSSKASSAPPAGQEIASANESRGRTPYAITIKAPDPATVGDPVVATIQVVPRGPYKINLEFPFKLQVTGGTSVSPQALEMTAKEAATLTTSELLLRPTFKVAVAGAHRFKGRLRFSVCTDKLCEIKTEAVSWIAVVTAISR